jgi:hypothetical protein
MQLVRNTGMVDAMRVVSSTRSLRPEQKADVEEGLVLLARDAENSWAWQGKGAALTLNEQSKIVPLSHFQVRRRVPCRVESMACTARWRAGEGVKEGAVRFGQNPEGPD